jgi:hypothetical protein
VVVSPASSPASGCRVFGPLQVSGQLLLLPFPRVSLALLGEQARAEQLERADEASDEEQAHIEAAFEPVIANAAARTPKVTVLCLRINHLSFRRYGGMVAVGIAGRIP